VSVPPDHAPPGSREELEAFARLQMGLGPMYERVFSDDLIPRTVVVVPSLSLDPEGLAKIPGVQHYEERMLCLLMLLRLPATDVVFVTSRAVHPSIVDYYLHLLPGVPTEHARRRLTMLDCDDGSEAPLTGKILDRPRLVQRIRNAVADPSSAHLTCFNSSPLERTLAVRLGIPLYACDPALSPLGNKSNGRDLFRASGVSMPEGIEHLRDEGDIVAGLAALRARIPGLRRAVVKHNEGFSGEGNAVFTFDPTAPDPAEEPWIRRHLRTNLEFEAGGETWERFLAKFVTMGGIVEAFVEGDRKRSPSVQCRIDPLGDPEIVSTHDQLLAGPTGQVYHGCTFPADEAYRDALHDAAERIARGLAGKGVIGRFSVDFVSVPTADGWRHYALDLNLRKGGTTLPFLMLQFLTDGTYGDDGIYRTPTGGRSYYHASDNVHHPRYRGLTPDDLIDIAVARGLHFDPATQQGVVFHLIGALSRYGKVGAVCIGDTPPRAAALYGETVRILNEETADDQPPA
jgi:hypothetical protein